MKKWIVVFALTLALLVCFAACDSKGEENQTEAPNTEDPKNEVTTEAPTTEEFTTEEITTEAPTTEEITTEAPTTEEPTTEEPTTEEITTEEPTTEAVTTEPETTEEETTEEETVAHPTREDVKAYASVVLEMDDILASANNPQQDWSDFGGLTVHEDGTFTALFRMGTDNVWDPYFYLIKQPTAVDNILVIQYRSELDQTLNMYAGTEGINATGAGDHISGELYATGDDWGYLILDLTEVAFAYEPNEAALGYLRFGLSMAESGDTIDFGFVAFFHTMEQVYQALPQ